MPSTKDSLHYVGGGFALELDGVSVGAVQSARGGEALADVIEEKGGPGAVIKKHIAGVKYSDIEVACGIGMSRTFYEWLGDTLDQRYVRESGAVVTEDYSGKSASRLVFTNALVSEIALPALDTGSKDSGKVTVKLAPEVTRADKGAAVSRHVDARQKKWVTSNFRLTVDGLDCSRVNRIEPLVIRAAISTDVVGDVRDYQRQPAHLEIPDLVITTAESNADDFRKWHEDFVIKGNCTDDREKSGTLEFLGPNMRDVLFRVGFEHLGIYKLGVVDPAGRSGSMRRLQAWMYCERMTFAAIGATDGGGASTSNGSGGSSNGTTSGQGATGMAETSSPTGALLVDSQDPSLVVVSGANGPVLTEEVPDRFTRIRRTV